VSKFLGHTSQGLAGLPPLLILLVVTAMTVFLSELTGTGLVRLPQMLKAGFWLNLAGILVITALATLFTTALSGNVY
jgi:di/tricarboxylate transporter